MSVWGTSVRTIGPTAVRELETFAEELVDGFRSADHPALADLIPACASQFVGELASACRPPEPHEGAFILRGLPVDDTEIGPTPPSWSETPATQTPVWDVMMLLIASALGRPFGWEGQQDGKLVHNILPTRGHERAQTGASSTINLSPHTEDAFHPERAHLLALGCLRNPDGIGTSAACVRHVDIEDRDRAILTRPRLPILPDSSYGDDGQTDVSPVAVSTLWERHDGLCSRFDPAYTPFDEADEEFCAAYRRLNAALTAALRPVPIRPGDILVIDNDTVVHGRAPFTPRYDGTDRWLKRINVRTPDRKRPPSETTEHGYAQRTVDVYRTPRRAAEAIQ